MLGRGRQPDITLTFRTGGTGGPNLAYQGVVGFGLPVGAVPGLKLTTDYRFIGIKANSGAVGNAYTAQGHNMGTVGLSPVFLHQFTVGVGYAFNHASPVPAAAPVPVATPPVTPARTYLVFFDWDRADLTERGRQIIAKAAQASTQVQTTRIQVNGYTDLSGAAAYNRGLLMRRARWRRSWCTTGCRHRRSRSAASGKTVRWCRRRRTCASRRTAGWK